MRPVRSKDHQQHLNSICIVLFPGSLEKRNTGTGQRSTDNGTSSGTGTGSFILNNSLVSSCLT